MIKIKEKLKLALLLTIMQNKAALPCPKDISAKLLHPKPIQPTPLPEQYLATHIQDDTWSTFKDTVRLKHKKNIQNMESALWSFYKKEISDKKSFEDFIVEHIVLDFYKHVQQYVEQKAKEATEDDISVEGGAQNTDSTIEKQCLDIMSSLVCQYERCKDTQIIPMVLHTHTTTTITNGNLAPLGQTKTILWMIMKKHNNRYYFQFYTTAADTADTAAVISQHQLVFINDQFSKQINKNFLFYISIILLIMLCCFVCTLIIQENKTA